MTLVQPAQKRFKKGLNMAELHVFQDPKHSELSKSTGDAQSSNAEAEGKVRGSMSSIPFLPPTSHKHLDKYLHMILLCCDRPDDTAQISAGKYSRVEFQTFE